jgi:hypothetical protein
MKTPGETSEHPTVIHHLKGAISAPFCILGSRQMKTNANQTDRPQLVIYGLDETGKPKAGRFAFNHAEAAKEAAASMKLTVQEVVPPQANEAMKKLPVGRIHARGKAFIPYIKRELYDQLCAAFSEKPAKEEAPGTAIERSLSIAKTEQTSALPTDWESIAPGHLVLLQESLPAGWYEAVVIARENELLTLRLRDYPKYPNFLRHYRSVGLLHRGA